MLWLPGVRSYAAPGDLAPGESFLSLDDSGAGRGLLLVALCRFSAVVSGSRVTIGRRCCTTYSGGHRGASMAGQPGGQRPEPDATCPARRR